MAFCIFAFYVWGLQIIISFHIQIVGTKGGDQFTNDRFYDDFTMDEVDLSIENYEELFGEGHNDPKHLFAKDGIDSLFGAKDTSVAESVCHGPYAAKVS